MFLTFCGGFLYAFPDRGDRAVDISYSNVTRRARKVDCFEIFRFDRGGKNRGGVEPFVPAIPKGDAPPRGYPDERPKKEKMRAPYGGSRSKKQTFAESPCRGSDREENKNMRGVQAPKNNIVREPLQAKKNHNINSQKEKKRYEIQVNIRQRTLPE